MNEAIGGNAPPVEDHLLAQDPLHGAWAEAAVVLQAEQDAEVHEEARELALAEMAAVTLSDRITALRPGSKVKAMITDASAVSGFVESAAPDHLLVNDGRERILLPLHAIAGITGAPRVMHDDATAPIGLPIRSPIHSTWRSVLRECLAREIQLSIGAAGRTITGALTWVGNDHLSIRDGRDEVTCPWSAVCAVRIPLFDS